jgi:hypothetical protein
MLGQGGCSHPSAEGRRAFALQTQKVTVLSAGRFASVQEEIESGKIDAIQQSLDYWIDMAIVELAALDNAYPEEHLDQVLVDSDSGLRMRSFYRRLALFRKSHPRKHVVPLSAPESALIEAFVQKYQ